jgi:hypothetical protein
LEDFSSVRDHKALALIALHFDWVHIIKKLIKHTKLITPQSLVDEAIHNKSYNVLEYLVRRADVEVTENHIIHALNLALSNEPLEMILKAVDILINGGLDPEIALNISMEMNQAMVFENLLNKYEITNPWRLIVDACKYRSLECLGCLLRKYIADVEALHVTIAQGDLLATELLIENNIEFDLRDISVRSLCRAPLGILELLVHKNRQHRPFFVTTVFTEACFVGRYDIVEFLLKHYRAEFEVDLTVWIPKLYNLTMGGIVELFIKYQLITLREVVNRWGFRANKATASVILKMCAQRNSMVLKAKDLKDFLVHELSTPALEKLPYIGGLRIMVLKGKCTLTKEEKMRIRHPVNSIELQVMGMIKGKGLDMTCKILEQLVGVSVYAHVKLLAERIPKDIKDVKRLRTHTHARENQNLHVARPRARASIKYEVPSFTSAP